MGFGIAAKILNSQAIAAANRIAPIVSATLLTICAGQGRISVSIAPKNLLPTQQKDVIDKFFSVGGG